MLFLHYKPRLQGDVLPLGPTKHGETHSSTLGTAVPWARMRGKSYVMYTLVVKMRRICRTNGSTGGSDFRQGSLTAGYAVHLTRPPGDSLSVQFRACERS